MIIALAGRRVDPRDAAPSRFSERDVPRVRERIQALFQGVGADALVGSGACGADLIGMEVAEGLGILRRMILPFDPALFRPRSVADRPGDWGPLFDRIAGDLAATGDLTALGLEGDSHAAYAAVNRAILAEAGRLARDMPPGTAPGVLAVVVWDGRPRGPDDLTADFAREAEARGLAVVQVSTGEDELLPDAAGSWGESPSGELPPSASE